MSIFRLTRRSKADFRSYGITFPCHRPRKRTTQYSPCAMMPRRAPHGALWLLGRPAFRLNFRSRPIAELPQTCRTLCQSFGNSGKPFSTRHPIRAVGTSVLTWLPIPPSLSASFRLVLGSNGAMHSAVVCSAVARLKRLPSSLAFHPISISWSRDETALFAKAQGSSSET